MSKDAVQYFMNVDISPVITWLDENSIHYSKGTCVPVHYIKDKFEKSLPKIAPILLKYSKQESNEKILGFHSITPEEPCITFIDVPVPPGVLYGLFGIWSISDDVSEYDPPFKRITDTQNFIGHADINGVKEKEYNESIERLKRALLLLEKAGADIATGKAQLTIDNIPVEYSELNCKDINYLLSDGGLKSETIGTLEKELKQIGHYRSMLNDAFTNKPYHKEQINAIMELSPDDFAREWTVWKPPAKLI